MESWQDSSAWTSDIAYPSLLAHRLSWQLLHPINKMTAREPTPASSVSFMTSQSPPCSMHLLNARTVGSATSSDETAILLHNVGKECNLLPQVQRPRCQATASSAGALFPLSGVRKTSLNLQQVLAGEGADLSVEPMQVEAFVAKIDL